MGRRIGSVRVRTVLGATLISAIALAVGGVAVVAIMRATLARNVRTAAFERGGEIAALVESGSAGVVLPESDRRDLLVQVIDERGRVLLASRHLRGRPPMLALEPGGSRQATVLVEGDDDEFIVAAVGARASGGPVTVLVARSLEPVIDSSEAVSRIVVVAIPLIVLLVALTSRLVVGRALAPVERMRAEVEAIGSAALDRRVQAPGGDDEVARLAVTMNGMLARLEAAQVEQRRFISDASHELRSPLAAIRQHAELARARARTDDLADVTLAETARLQSLVDDLLVLARLDEGVAARGREVDLDDLVFEEAARLRAAGATVDTAAVSAGRVTGDPTSLTRMVRNLMDNAARYARNVVTVSLDARDGVVVLVVDDDGPGIPAEDRARVLRRFERLDEARARSGGGGAGLGLAIVAEVARSMGGEISVAESPAGGARLSVRLPGS